MSLHWIRRFGRSSALALPGSFIGTVDPRVRAKWIKEALAAAAVLVLAAVAMARPADAATDPANPSSRPPLSTGTPEDPIPPKEFLYDGNHVGWMIGPAFQGLGTTPPGLDPWGKGLRVGGRISAVTQFVDGGIDLQHIEHGGASAGLSRTDVGIRVGTHPALPIVVFNSWLNDVLSGVHLYVGATVGRIALQGSPAVAAVGLSGAEAVQWRPGALVGAGVDVPVSPRNRSSGLWLTLRYELQWTGFGGTAPRHDLDAGLVAVLLGYRSYNNSWGRIARPF